MAMRSIRVATDNVCDEPSLPEVEESRVKMAVLHNPRLLLLISRLLVAGKL
jgi:hypothetical protein